MSRTAHHPKGPPPAPKRRPVPPPDGWTLMEAAEALCPREARLYKQGGPALDAGMGVDGPDEWGLGGEADAWLSELVLAALAKRRDLVLTGRDMVRDIRAERYRLPRDVLLAALRGSPDLYSHHEIRVRLRFDDGTAGVEYWPAKLYPVDPSFINLIEVRVEASGSAGGEAACTTMPEPPAAGRGAPTKPEFSHARCRAWFRLRVDGWPKDEPTPTREDCLATAREHFAGKIPRDLFRAIRRGMVPESWQKRGRRRPPN